MNTASRKYLLCLLGTALLLPSCSSVKTFSNKVRDTKLKTPKLTFKAPNFKAPKFKAPNLKMPTFKKPNMAFLNPKNFTWKDLRRGKRIPIVEVDEKKLKKGPNGEQLYLAYNSKKRKYGYLSGPDGSVFTPVDFDPGKLPGGDGSKIPSSGILPSLTEGGSSKLATGGNGDLPPVDLPEIPDDLKMPQDFGVPTTPEPVELPEIEQEAETTSVLPDLPELPELPDLPETAPDTEE